MISRYCKGFVKPEHIVPITVNVMKVISDDEGNSTTIEVPEETDTSLYGTLNEWSLDAMIKAGINPESFSSPIVAHTRLEAANLVNSIDLSSLDNTTE